MTRKQIRRAARHRAGIEDLNIRAQRRNGACTVIVNDRSGNRLLLASAPTWAQAYRQVRSGFTKEAR